MAEIKRIYVDHQCQGQRLDIYLSGLYPEYSRSHIQSLIRDGLIVVDGQKVKSGYKLAGGEFIAWEERETKPMRAEAENLALNICYEDSDIIVVNKPQGMVVHPAVGHREGTLVNALLHHCGDLSGINGVIRPGIVHRLDKDTSGLLVAAKNDAAHLGLTSQWQGHRIMRIYHALVEDIIAEDRGSVDAPLSRHKRDRKKIAIDPYRGKNAVTHYRVLERFAAARKTYLELRLETGRTHQIRVHLAHLGHPVLGDASYGRRKQKLPLAGQALHAKVLGFKHPISGEYLEFDSPLPDYFQQLLMQFRAEDNRDGI
ncbi:MAG: RluA family pseudouridine synthase [Clostridia bacterium]|nr:RluA family pseudouridine synthase [Clostridia bacterium]